jgi:Cytochrome C biogenesis protein transmembrane region
VIELGPAALATAFAAGFLSFTSPCVLPLVPSYLSYVCGVGVDELGANPRRVTVTTAWFVAGFTTIFVAFGAGAAWFGTALIEQRPPGRVHPSNRRRRTPAPPLASRRRRLGRAPRRLRSPPDDRAARRADLPPLQVQRRRALRGELDQISVRG